MDTMSDPILIRRVRDPHGWLGNMAPYRISHGGLEYRTTEALFQALRFANDGSLIREAIRVESSPMAAKLLSKKHADKRVIVPQSVGDLDNMRLCLRLKLNQNPELQLKLVDTGDRRIIEDCTRRQRDSGLFWGAAEQEDGSWFGLNWLGELWMAERTRLKSFLF